jgi:hypothetical protein
MWGLLCRRPGSASQRCYTMADGQIHALNKSRVQPPREAQVLQSPFEICLCPQAHQVRDAHQLTPPIVFLHLAVDQACCYLPLTHVPASTMSYEPLSEMGREGIEVQIQPITREKWDATWS